MRERCGYCTTTDGVERTPSGNYICGACMPRWLEVRKRAFAGTIKQRGCTGRICDHGAVVHDGPCAWHDSLRAGGGDE